MASGLLCIYYFPLLKRFFSFGSFKVSKVEDNGCPAFLVWSFWWVLLISSINLSFALGFLSSSSSCF
jgi:hypothetical protein